MPVRRKLHRARESRTILRPGFTSHRGLISMESNLNQEGSRKGFQHLSAHEEGVLYTVKVGQRSSPSGKDNGKKASGKDSGDAQPPELETTNEHKLPLEPQQYTISKLHKHQTWAARLCRSFGIELRGHEDVDSHLYKPSKSLAGYINWTFYASFTAVFFTFLAIFIVICLLFSGLLALAGEMQPDCIVVSGDDYGTNPNTKFGDSFALSWTTFTTVGYGNVYPATGMDYDIAKTQHCAGVVFLCTLEAFLGMIYAGMCAAILFGKITRVQSHAHLSFANAVCLQYEDVDMDQFVDDDIIDSDCDDVLNEDEGTAGGNDKKNVSLSLTGKAPLLDDKRATFREQFRGCPVLKFQVVNDLCNKAGGEIVDGVMKVVGIKMKYLEGKLNYTQYVRVNLVDFEHPFFGRVWHGVHILDGSSPLLKKSAKEKINNNRGSWPNDWVTSPDKIRRKLDFHSLVVTISGLSNLSASTVHAYKRYKFEDVIIGFDFTPLVYEVDNTGKLEVDLGLIHDVREQQMGHGEDLKSGSNAAKNSSEFSKGTSSVFKESVFH